jgi:hypothetical protein
MILPRNILPLLLSLAAPLAAQDIFAPTETARMEAASSLQPLPKNRVVTLKTISGDFAANPVAAVGKYGGRRIAVVGRVSALKKSGGENKALVVTMQDASAALPAVKCGFLAGSFPENSSIEISSDGSQAFLVRRDRSGNILGRETYLSVGQKVAIRGDYKEVKVGDVVLTACELLPKAQRKMIQEEN